MATKNYHMCLDVRGALRWGKSKLKGMFRNESGRTLTPDEAVDFLHDCLLKGWKVIPLTHAPCEGFSYEKGCQGHAVGTEEAA